MNKSLEKKISSYCDKQKLVTIVRNPEVDQYRLQGFVVAYSRRFVLIAHEYDFFIDGWRVVDRTHIEKIEATHRNDYCKKILQKEGLLGNAIVPPFTIDLSDYMTVLGSLKKHKQFVIVEDERPDTGVFLIGPIKRINKNSVSIRHFDAKGRWVSGKRAVDYKDITVIQFGNNYIRLHQKYVNGGIYL